MKAASIGYAVSEAPGPAPPASLSGPRLAGLCRRLG